MLLLLLLLLMMMMMMMIESNKWVQTAAAEVTSELN